MKYEEDGQQLAFTLETNSVEDDGRKRPGELFRRHIDVQDFASLRIESGNFPEGTTFHFEPGTFERGGGQLVPCYYLIGCHPTLAKLENPDYEYNILLWYDESYHIFSPGPTMYGGYIHDESNQRGWTIDRKGLPRPSDGFQRCIWPRSPKPTPAESWR